MKTKNVHPGAIAILLFLCVAAGLPAGERHRAVEHPSAPTTAPVAVADSYSASEGMPLSVAAPGVLANDTPNGAAIASYGASTGAEQTSIGTSTPTAQGGTVTLNADGSFNYIPAANFAGSDAFKYVLTGPGGSSSAVVTLTVVAALPVAVADSYSTSSGVPLNVPAPGVLANDTPNGAAIASYGASSGTEQMSIGMSTATAQGGAISLNADGSFSYSAASGFGGSDSFKYILSNSAGNSTATVTVTVNVAPPSASADSYTTPKGMTLNVPAPGVLANDTLRGGRIVSYGVTGSEQKSIGSSTPTAQNGMVSLNSDGSFTFSPASNFTGNDSFRYILQNAGGSSTATVTIAVQAPTGPDFVVTSPGFTYAFSGSASGDLPVLTLTSGRTYTFQINTSSAHPFRICSGDFGSSCGSLPAGSVTNNNISNGTLTFTVPMTAQNYFYECSVHHFGNTIMTVP